MTELPSRIPADLYQVITEHISRRRDLATLCRVSRVFRHEAERALYRKVVVREETVMFFCHGGVLTNRRLASMVRSLSLTLSSSTFPFYQSAAMLSDALRGLSNLRNLELWGSAMPHLIHSQFIFRGCKLNLQRFGSSVPLDTQLIQFLATQPNITHWTTTSRAYIEIPGSILPHLSCIDASASAMEKVTDQRHLTHIRVNRAGNALPTNLLGPWTVSISLQPIVLSSQLVNINEDWRSVCRTIAKLAPNVRFLEISRSRLVKNTVFQVISIATEHLTKLQTLVIIDDYAEDRIFDNREVPRDLVISLQLSLMRWGSLRRLVHYGARSSVSLTKYPSGRVYMDCGVQYDLTAWHSVLPKLMP